MDFTKLTLKSQEAVAAAQELARRSGNPELYPEHLLLALLDQELPRELVPDAEGLRAQAEATLATKPRIEGAQQQPNISAQVSKVLDRAFDERAPVAGGLCRFGGLVGQGKRGRVVVGSKRSRRHCEQQDRQQRTHPLPPATRV